MESTWSPPGVHQESIRSLPGVHQEYQDFIRTPDGVHQDAWGSVTYSHKKAFLGLKQVLTTQPVLKAPCFDGTPFIVTSDSCKDGFGVVLAQKSIETLPNGKVASKLHPIAFASKWTSPVEEKYKPFMLEFTTLKFAMDKFNDIIWGFLIEIKIRIRVSMSALMGDPDPYLWVYRLPKLKLKSV